MPQSRNSRPSESTTTQPDPDSMNAGVFEENWSSPLL